MEQKESNSQLTHLQSSGTRAVALFFKVAPRANMVSSSVYPQVPNPQSYVLFRVEILDIQKTYIHYHRCKLVASLTLQCSYLVQPPIEPLFNVCLLLSVIGLGFLGDPWPETTTPILRAQGGFPITLNSGAQTSCPFQRKAQREYRKKLPPWLPGGLSFYLIAISHFALSI